MVLGDDHGSERKAAYLTYLVYVWMIDI